MAGKSEQSTSHPAPPNHNHHHPQPAQGIQQNSVLVYVSGENFAYATAIGQNAATSEYQSQQQPPQTQQQQQQQQQQQTQQQQQQQNPQQQTAYSGILQQDSGLAFSTKSYATGNANCTGTINRALVKSLEFSTSNPSTPGRASDGTSRTRIYENVENTGFGTIVTGSNGVLYRQTSLINGQATLGTLTSCQTKDGKSPAPRSDAEGLVANDAGTSRVNAALDALGKGFPMRAPQRLAGEASCPTAAYPVARMPEAYSPVNRIALAPSNAPADGCVGILDENARITFVQQTGETCTTTLTAGLYSGNPVEIHGASVKCEATNAVNHQVQDILDVQQGAGSVTRCDSVRSDTAESSYSSLSSPDSQNHSQDTSSSSSVCAQQAARSLPQSNLQHNVVLTMNGSAVTQQQQQHQQQRQQQQHQQQQQPSISVPHGWKRICTNGVIIYISPSSTALGSLDQLKEYLTTAGTCKCGLECPLRPDQVFNFDPKVATRPWSPDQGKTREMTKLCNHKRKLLLPTAAASPVASCTPAVSSSTLSILPPPPTIQATPDSPTSTDKTKKDGLNKKKKRKLASVGGLYSGVSVSQLLAQRERALAAAAATGVQGSPISNGPQVWPIAIPNLQVQQNNQQINHQSLNSPSQSHESNGVVGRNAQHRLGQHNMTGMVMGNPLIMNQQGTNLSNMTQQQQQLLQQQHQQLILQQQQQQQQQLMQQHISQQQQHQQQQQQQQQQLLHHQQMQHMQILHQQHQQQQQQEQHPNVVTNQMTQQQASPYLNQLNQQSLHMMQQQQPHINQQQQMQQQLHLQQIQKHNMNLQQQQQQHVGQDSEQQIPANYNSQHPTESFVHHMQPMQNSSQPSIHPQLHQLHQHQMQQMQHQQQSNQHIMQTQQPEHFQMQIQQQQQQQQISQSCAQTQYPNQAIAQHTMDVMQHSNGASVMAGINPADVPNRQNRTPSIGEEDLNTKQLQHQQQQQLHQHNHTMQRHHVIQNGNLPNNSHDNMQRIYAQHQMPYPVRNFDPTKAPNLETKLGHQQYTPVSHSGRSPNSNHTIDAQPGMGPNGQPGNMHFNARAPPWQQNRTIAASHQSPPVTMQSITCNTFDRVPPLHHHIPPASAWTDEVARKKAKTSKVMVKKQRQHSMVEIRNNGLDQSILSPSDEFTEKNQSSNHIGSTVSNTSPSFLEDPSGYLAQQTALLNSTISRQTGVSSSQVTILNSSKVSQTTHGVHVPNNVYLPQPKPSSIANPTNTSVTNSVKNHATSPVVVHSSMTPTSANSVTLPEHSPCQGCVSSVDTQSYMQDQYKHQMHRQYLTHSDQRDDPVTSSTFGERFPTSQQIDSRPIQGGTVSTSHGSPVGTNSPANSDTPASSTSGISQPATPQSMISSQPSTPHSYSQPPTPHSHPTSGQIPPQPLTPQSQQPSQSSMSGNGSEQPAATPPPCPTTTPSSSLPPSTSPSQIVVSSAQIIENESGNGHSKRNINGRQSNLEGYQPHPHTINAVSSRVPLISYSRPSSVITTMASGHTVSSNTITSVLAGRTNTATVSINTPSVIPNPAIPNILTNKSHLQTQSTVSTSVPCTTNTMHHASSSPITHSQSSTMSVSKSPLEMVQSVVSSIQVPQASSSSPAHPHTHHQQHHQSNVQVHNVITSGGILKHSSGSGLPPGHILVSSGGQLIMASTGSGISGVMAPPPPKIISNASSMPPLSVSPMVTSVTGAVSQVIPAVGVAQQVIGQPTVLVNTIQTPVLIQPGVMTMDSISQNVQIPHLTVATGNVIQNAQSILEANQDVTRNVNTNPNIVNRQPALLSPESGVNKKKAYKKRKSNSQTVASMLHIASSQQNTGMLMQSQSNFAQQNFQTQSLGGPMLQALTIVPGKGGAPAQLVMNGQTGATSTQFNAQQIITNPQPTQQINLLQPVNLLNGTTGMVQNFPTIQQFIVPGIGSMVMSADGTATLLQDTGNIGMQLQIQNVNGQNVLTPVQSHSGIFSPSQSILAAGPAGMVIRAPQTTGGKIIQQHSPGAQFLSPNSGQFLVNGTTSFGNQLSPIVANVSPNQQVTFNTSQVRPQNIQGQQEFIQMNGQTLMVPCATTQNIAVSTAPNQQNTTFVQQNTTIVQQQTTMVSNNQIPNFQSAASNNGNRVDPTLNLDHNQSYILSSGMIQGKSPSSPKSSVNSPSSEQNVEQQQYLLASSSTTVVEKTSQQTGQHSPLMVRHSVSTQTAGNQANVAQSTLMRQGSPPDTTTHSPGNSQRSNSPAVDTTTHGAASPAPAITARHHSSSTPMVHCVSSSEPDSGEAQVTAEDWRIHGITAKEITLGQPGIRGKTYVESTVTTGIQIYTSETLKQAEGVVSSVRYEGRDHALGRGIKRKLDSIHSMHSTLHEDQDVSEDQSDAGNSWKLEVGELVWGAARGNPAWPGKVESLGPPGSLTVWVRWYGGGRGLSQVDAKTLKSLSDGLEAHHRARKKFRKSRKLNMQLENAIQEAMAELDRMSESQSAARIAAEKCNGQAAATGTTRNSSSRTTTSITSKSTGSTRSETKRLSKRSETAKTERKSNR